MRPTRSSGSISRTCLFEWQAIPDGLVQDQAPPPQNLSGTVEKSSCTMSAGG